MVSEAAKKGPYHINNMHMDKCVIGVTDFKCEVLFDLGGCLEAVVASEADKKGPCHINNMHMDK